MARVVVISTDELEPDALDSVLEPDDEVHVLVAAVQQSRLQWLVSDEDKARAEAQHIAEQIRGAAPGNVVSIEVKPDPPAQVVKDAIAEHRPERIVVAVREGEEATWLEEDELGRLPAEVDGVPLTRIALAVDEH